MNSANHNTLYIILNYALNNNIYELISSIQKYCFSFISLSLQYNFHLYLIYNNSYTLLFPNKIKDPTYFITSNYTEISNSIKETLDDFFENVTDAEDKFYPNDMVNNSNAINVIFKKILLEINQKNNSKKASGQGNFFLSSSMSTDMNDRIILINDSANDFDNINQKYVFLFKKEKIKIDILSLNEQNKNTVSKALCLYTNGFFDNTTKKKNNVEQILIQEYIPIKRKEFFQSNNDRIQNSINYNKVISDKDLECSQCHKIIINKEEKDEANNNNYSFGSLSSINNNNRSTIDGNNRINNNNSINNLKLFYLDKEKNIICFNCFFKKQ